MHINFFRVIPPVAILILFAIGCNNDEQKKLENEPKTEKEQASIKSEPLPPNTPPQDREGYYNGPPEMSIDDSKQYIATIHTDKGQIVMELDALYAPQHVNNFVFLAKEGFFDGLTFHRYDPGFVIQGGDPLGVGTGGPGYRIPAEIGLLHEKGAVAMARQGDARNPEKKSSGSQFYITLKATPFLDGDYSVFGKVVAGMDVVQQIRRGDVMTKVVVEEK